jgi:uncharacterized membrane protein
VEAKTKAIIATIASSIITTLWVLGLLFADIRFFIVSMAILSITIIFAIKNFKEINEFFKNFKTKDGNIIEDERTEYIEERASVPAFGSVLAINIYAGIAIITLRNSYPQYTTMAYAFFFTGIIGLLTFSITRIYYKKKYSE